MSQCHKCDNPCGHVLTFQIPSTLPYCVIGPVLEALPTASIRPIGGIGWLVTKERVSGFNHRYGKVTDIAEEHLLTVVTQRDKEA